MSDVFEDPKEDFKYDEDRNMLRAGISFSLLQFYDHLIKKNIFLPGGMCSHVHLGGIILLTLFSVCLTFFFEVIFSLVAMEW